MDLNILWSIIESMFFFEIVNKNLLKVGLNGSFTIYVDKRLGGKGQPNIYFTI